MQLPLQITFRHLDPSEAIENNIRKHADELDQFYDHIMSCHVVVDAAHQHHHQGKLYQVHIDVTVPGREFVASREPGQHHAHEDIYVAIRDAFNAIRRQLEDHARKQRGKVKSHEAVPHGKINELNATEDYGRILTADGRDVYFHRNSLLDADFDDLEVGMEVRFAEEAGEMGPQASSVHVIGKHHIVT